MATDLYTSGQKPEKIENLSTEIKSAIAELRKAFPEENIEALYWNDSYVAVPLEIEVNLPTRGTVGDIDIREREPIYLLLDRQNYPYKAPSVWYNRKDFPASQLPHLNPTSFGRAASLCLHRGSIDNWFAEHTITELVNRARGWLSDAARDRLIRKEDGFEPTRVNDEIVNYSVFEPSAIWDFVKEKWRQNNQKAGFAFLWYKLLRSPSKEPLIGKDAYAIQLVSLLDLEHITEPLEISKEINCFYTEENKLDRMLFGILAWPPKNSICKKFFAELPVNIMDFQRWTENLDIPLKVAFQKYLLDNLQLLGGIPVTLVVPRPQKLIGMQSELELINFLVVAGGDYWPKEGTWNPDTKVETVGHRVPLTLRRARDISSKPNNLDFGKLLFLGCGAVGSKLILHLARSGQGNMTLVDFDSLSPHNLVRHALLNGSLGMNKAEAIKNAISGIFYADKDIKIDIIKESALNIFLGKQNDTLNRHKWIIDTTASPVVLNALSEAVIPRTVSCCRCEIADMGQLGILSVEGSNRNPRLDDIQVAIFDMADRMPVISHWLQSNRKEREEEIGSRLSEINIGISCSSETMRLSDEVVSLHAAYFSSGFRKIARRRRAYAGGLIQINQYDEEGFEANVDALIGFSQQFEIPPVTIVNAKNDPNWQVRLKYGIEQRLHTSLRKVKPNETGGLLVGRINFKRKIIYVTDFLPAPADSESSPYAFVRGIQDIPNKIFEIEELTGGMLSYVGEWHTHPLGGTRLSPKDEEAVKKIRRHLDSILRPTHVMIVTKNGLHPYIFDPR
jgi:hypothetical protein